MSPTVVLARASPRRIPFRAQSHYVPTLSSQIAAFSALSCATLVGAVLPTQVVTNVATYDATQCAPACSTRRLACSGLPSPRLGQTCSGAAGSTSTSTVSTAQARIACRIVQGDLPPHHSPSPGLRSPLCSEQHLCRFRCRPPSEPLLAAQHGGACCCRGASEAKGQVVPTDH
jgi:hypothetical protein